MALSTQQQQRTAAVATVTFLTLFATALYTVLYHASASGVRASFAKLTLTPLPTYTGLAQVDGLLNNAVALFHAGFRHTPYAAHFLVGLAPGVLAYVVEYSRTGSLGATAAMGVGMAYQVGTTGAVMPLAWLAIVLHRNWMSQSTPAPPFTRTQAQATVGGVLLGYALLTVLMLALENDIVTVLWQIFPVFVWAVQQGWLLYARRTKKSSQGNFESGLPTLRVGFAILALLSAAQHLRVLAGASSLSPSAFVKWWPSFRAPNAADVTLPVAAAHLLQWTSIVCYAAIFAGAAFLRVGESPASPAAGALGDSTGEVLKFLLLAPLVSPGAVVALFWLRREERLVKLQTERSVAEEKRRSKRLHRQRERVLP